MLGYTEDQPVTVELRGEKVNRIALSDYGIDPYSTNIIVYQTYLAKNPEVVRQFLKASLEGWVYAIENASEATDAYMAERPESNRAFNEANLRQLIPILQSEDVAQNGFGAQNAERWTSTQDILFDLGMIERKVDISTLFTNDYR